MNKNKEARIKKLKEIVEKNDFSHKLPITWKGKEELLEVYQIPLECLIYNKHNGNKHFTVIDGAMNDLIRPALYDAYQRIEPVGPPREGSRIVDVVGPVCESADFLAQQRELPILERDDLLAVHSAGAYGFAMSSNYNGRPRPAEVVVAGERSYLTRRRETYDDLTAGESIPEGLC